MKKIFRGYRTSDYIFTLMLSILLIVFYLYQDLAKWPLITFIRAQGPITYVDSSTVLYYANCFSRIGSEVFAAGTNCANWNYGSGILKFINLIGANKNYTSLFGHFFTYFILSTFIYLLLLYRKYRFTQVTMFIGFISPSIWLLMERANFDALIYLLIFFAAIFARKGFEIIPIILIFVSAVFKFYTLPLIIILIFLSNKMYVKLIGLVSLLSGTIIILNDFKLMDGMSLQAGNNHFGMKIIGNYLGKVGIKLNLISAYFLGAILLFSTILLVLMLLKKFELILLWENSFIKPVDPLFVYMSVTFLLCFIAGLSVDYRLIFYLVSVPFLISKLTTRLRSIVSAIFLIGAWLCYPFGIFQTVGDMALELIVAFQIIMVFLSLYFRINRKHADKLGNNN